MDSSLLKKYLNNDYSGDDLKLILKWIDESSEDIESKILLYGFWDKISDDDETIKPDFDNLLNKIHQSINFHENELQSQHLIKAAKLNRVFRIIRNIAAILLLPVLVYTTFLTAKYNSVKSLSDNIDNQAFNEVFSSVDAITKVTLQDGTVVWLNHSSSLKYPAQFKGDVRSVELQGEGYFEVAHNEKSPFIVKVQDIEIVAVGTKFNILAYPDENKIQTSLIDGIVMVQRHESGSEPTELIRMKPSDLVEYNKSDKNISTRTIMDDRYFSWKEGKLIFNKEPMGEVVNKLRRWFNADIEITDPRLLDLTYTGTFINENLKQVLELLERVTPVTYSISSRHEIGSGTFSKRKVKLKYEDKNNKENI